MDSLGGSSGSSEVVRGGHLLPGRNMGMAERPGLDVASRLPVRARCNQVLEQRGEDELKPE